VNDEDEFYRRARAELFHNLKNSAMSVTIFASDPDPKLCMELGAAIMFDKPIIVVVPADRKVSANLRRVASSIIQGDINDPHMKARLINAIEQVMANDQRAKQ
jgi:hypothetical protein